METLTSLSAVKLDDVFGLSTVIPPWKDVETIENESSKRKSGYDENIIKELTEQYKQDISDIIENDFFEDGVVSQTEKYVLEMYEDKYASVIKNAMMELYLKNYNNSHMLTGLLIMAGSLSYEQASPQGPIMATGLLSHTNNSIKDRAIRTFERWNSKEGLIVLKNVECSALWMQKYVEKVIRYLERDGT